MIARTEDSFGIELHDLIRVLREDPETYYAWQANIAVAFQDEFRREIGNTVSHEAIHRISNSAAKNFLNLLIK